MMKSGPFQLFPLLALTPTRPLVPTLVPRLIALLVLFLHNGVTRLVTVTLLIKLTLLLHLPGILIP
jgi:hypothetical protein